MLQILFSIWDISPVCVLCSLTTRHLQSRLSQMTLLTSHLSSGHAKRYQNTYPSTCLKPMLKTQLMLVQPAESVCPNSRNNYRNQRNGRIPLHCAPTYSLFECVRATLMHGHGLICIGIYTATPERCLFVSGLFRAQQQVSQTQFACVRFPLQQVMQYLEMYPPVSRQCLHVKRTASLLPQILLSTPFPLCGHLACVAASRRATASGDLHRSC